MLSIGCIQAMRCHTGHCPTGVATQNRWLMRGLDPHSKSERLANYIMTLRKELISVSRACGQPHPSLVSVDQLEILQEKYSSTQLSEIFGTRHHADWGLPPADQEAEIRRLMQPSSQTG